MSEVKIKFVLAWKTASTITPVSYGIQCITLSIISYVQFMRTAIVSNEVMLCKKVAVCRETLVLWNRTKIELV